MEGASTRFQNDIHYKRGISCADCHGGDPSSDDQNISMSAERGFHPRAGREKIAEMCGVCHSNAAFMHKHNPNQPVDQVKLYSASIHASTPVGSNAIAATCVDCHGYHGTRAVGDPQSTVAPARLARTCGKCHEDSSELFQKSVHGGLFVTDEMPSCATCHSSHSVSRVTNDMLAGGRAVCSRCHEPDTKGGRTAAALGRTFENARMASMSSTPPPPPPAGGTSAGAAAGGQGRSGPPRGPRATDPRMRKALSLVHSLDVAAVKAAAEAAFKQ
jgi:predicted CXXCH cytochrome family protein